MFFSLTNLVLFKCNRFPINLAEVAEIIVCIQRALSQVKPKYTVNDVRSKEW